MSESSQTQDVLGFNIPTEEDRLKQESIQGTQRAWLLDFGHGLLAAVANNEMSQVRMESTMFPVPRAPKYCAYVTIIGQHILPVLDMAALFSHNQTKLSKPAAIGIAVYQEAGELFYVGLRLMAMPIALRVSDSQACELVSDVPALWNELALSCFTHEGMHIPVLSLKKLFSAEFRDYLRSLRSS